MRTVRSAARRRNRPRRRLAWLLVLILLVLIALAARVDAAPGADPIDPAIGGGDVLGGDDAEAAIAADRSGDDVEEDADGAAARRTADRDGASERDATGGDNAIEGDDAGDDAGRDLVEQAGEIGGVDHARDGSVDDDPIAEDATPDEPPGLAVAGDGAPADPGPTDLGAGANALLESELDPGDATAAADAADAVASAGAAELHEQSTRQRAAARWGHLDVGLSWRRRASAPMHAPPSRHDEVWLVATWRR